MVPLVEPEMVREQDKAMKIIAKSFYRELRQGGYQSRQIIALTAELVELVTLDLKAQAKEDGAI